MADFIDKFMKASGHIITPEIFRKWAAISLVGSVLERKVWVHTAGSTLYPNTYIFLVAPPGVGKSEITHRIHDLLASVEELFCASSSLTKAALIDDLHDANRKIFDVNLPGGLLDFNSLQIVSNELGVLLPAYDMEFMATLTDLYDCKLYKERRRSSKTGPIVIPAPQFNLLAGCTPSYLTSLLPDGSWDQGFLSRVVLIFSGEQALINPFEDTAPSETLWEQVKADLRSVFTLSGKLGFSPEAQKVILDWHLGGGLPKPDHPKLHHYNTRRLAHVLKLCQIAYASRSIGEKEKSMIISEADASRALRWMISAEIQMPEIFKAMTSGGDSSIINDTWHMVLKTYRSTDKPVSQHILYAFLQARTPAYNVERIISNMISAGMLKKTIGKNGVATYTPGTL